MSAKALHRDHSGSGSALIPASGITSTWIDQMILAGRLFIGQETDHQNTCKAIRQQQKRPRLTLVVSN